MLVHDRQAGRARPYREAVGNDYRLSPHALRFCPRRRAYATGARGGPGAGCVGRLTAALGGRFLFRSGPLASDSDGGLFETVEGYAEVRGGWGVPQRRRAKRAAAVAALAGASVVLLSRRAANARRY